jgi:hypothetical protein
MTGHAIIVFILDNKRSWSYVERQCVLGLIAFPGQTLLSPDLSWNDQQYNLR